MKIKRILPILLAIAAAATLFSCSSGKDPADTTDPEYNDNGLVNAFAGVVVSAGETKIEKNSNFDIAEIKVSVGDTVKAGDVLFIYDTKKAELSLERAKLDLEQYEANLDSYKQNKAKLEAEKATAPADMQLQYSLEIQEAEAEILECEYNIKSKTKEVESLAATIEKTEVTSPVEGTVSSISNESDPYGQPSAFMVIKETGNLRVQGYVNETNINDITLGSAVTVKSRVDDSVWQGTVASIDTEKPEQTSGDYYNDYINDISADSSSKYPFYVELDSSEGLMLGQHVYIIVSSDFAEEDGVIAF